MVLTFTVSWQQCQSKVGNRKSKNKFFADGDERVQTFEALPLWPQKQPFPPCKAVSNISAFQAAALNFLNKFSSFEGAWLEGVKEREMFISVCKCPDHHHGLTQGGRGRKCAADHQPKLCFWSCQLKQQPSILRKIRNVNSHRPGQARVPSTLRIRAVSTQALVWGVWVWCHLLSSVRVNTAAVSGRVEIK